MAGSDPRKHEEDEIKRFDPRILDRSVIAIPLLEEINRDDTEIRAVIIDVNIDYHQGRDAGRTWIREAIQKAVDESPLDNENQGVREKKTKLSNQYIFARLSGKVIRELVRLDAARATTEAKKAEKPRVSKKRGKASVQSDTAIPYRFRAIYRIWPDFKVGSLISRTVSTICNRSCSGRSPPGSGTDVRSHGKYGTAQPE